MMHAKISPTSPRRQTWLEVFGSDTVPVLSCEAVLMHGPDGDRRCYQLDVNKLKMGDYLRVARYLSNRWKLPPDEVTRLMRDPDHGVPIDAQDVTIEADLRLFV